MAIADLNNKIVFITGAAAGIGYETALAFGKANCTVIATDLSEAALTNLATEMEKRNQSCHTYTLDVTDRKAFMEIAQKVISEVGCPDVIVNNAGIGYMGSFEDTPPEMWSLTLDINIMGVVNGCQAFLPAMKEGASSKHIVNIASMASRTPVPNMASYAASKFAVEGLSKTLSMELSNSHVGVTCVHPAVINTDIVRNDKMVSRNITDDQIERLKNHYATKGCHPNVVANDIVAAVRSGKFSLYTGPNAGITARIFRLLPWSIAGRLSTAAARKVGYL